jgi:GntR family phosphonate transport system transcriptional regulator
MRDRFLTPGDTPSVLTSLRDGGRPVWRQIEDILVAEIARGVYPPESQLPTENELAARFDVNRHTVRQAVAAVAQRGLLLVEQGRGSFVVRDAIDYALGPRTRFSANLLSQGRDPATELIGIAEERAGIVVARELKVRPGTKLLRLDSLGRANARPITLGRHYFPARLVPGLADAFTQYGSITKALRQAGIGDYRRQWTRVTARLPTADEAHLLRCATTQPLLVTEGLNTESGGRPLEYAIGLFASDRVQFMIKLSSEGP